jgi:hypothetical protein
MLERSDVRASIVREGEYAEVDVPEDVGAAERVIARHKEVWGTAETAESA